MKKLYILLLSLLWLTNFAQAQERWSFRRLWGILDIEGTNPYRAPAFDYGTYRIDDDFRMSALLGYQPHPMWQFGAGVAFAYGDTEFRIAPTSAVADVRCYPWRQLGAFANARLSVPITAVRGGVFGQYGTLSLTVGYKFDGLPIPLPLILEDLIYVIPFLKTTASLGARLDFFTGRRGELQTQPSLVLRLGVDI